MSKRFQAIINIFEDKNKKRLVENVFSLSVLQVANFILPLVTIPYLVRVLGAEKFGLVMFAYAFNQYFAMLIDFGFNLSATRENAKMKIVDYIEMFYNSVLCLGLRRKRPHSSLGYQSFLDFERTENLS